MLPGEVACKFFSLSALEVRSVDPFDPDPRLVTEIDRQQADERRKISERNGRLFEEEASKLDGWAEDLKVGLERKIKDLDRQLREARRAASTGLTLEEKLAGQRQVKKLEGERNDKRRKLFVAQDEIEQCRDALIESVQSKLEQQVTLVRILSIRWQIQ
jgi:adenine-specific DNA-methyltransferase